MSATADRAAHAQETTLANRYGVERPRASRRRLWIALGALAALTAVALAVVIGLNMSVGQIEHKTVGYEIRDADTAAVTFQVSVPEGVTAECDLLVYDSQAAPVGFRTVRLESLAPEDRARPSDAEQIYTSEVRTVVRGSSGVVDACRRG